MTTRSSAEEIARKYHQQSLQENKHHRRLGYVRTPTVFQMEVSECGAAALGMILEYYGKIVPLEELRVETGVSRNGCNARNMYTAAERYGLKVDAYYRDFDRLKEKCELPCILHWNYSHFVVFEGKQWGRYVLNDPQIGRRRLTEKEMQEGFSGTEMDFAPTDSFVKSGKKKTIIGFLIERLRGQTSTMWALVLIGIALIVPGVLNSMFSQIFADDILIDGRFSWTSWLLVTMLLTALFDAYFSFLSSRLQLMLRTKMSMLSTDKMIYHMLRLPMDFFEQRYAGDLVQRVTNNMVVSDFLSGRLTGVLISFLTSLVYLLIMMVYNVKLAIVGVVTSITSISVAIIISDQVYNMAMKFGIDNAKLLGAFYNGLTANSSLKAVGGEYSYTAKVLGYYTETNNNDQKLGFTQSILDVIPQTLSSFNNVIILVLGALIVVDGGMTIGMIIAFTGFLGSFSSPFREIITFVRSLQQVRNDAARVEDIMNYREDETYVSPKRENMEGRKLLGDVEVRDVSFAYGRLDRPFIKHFNFKVESGHSVALVGESGCGKSTVAKMVAGLYKPWSGQILFDGVDISEVPRSVMNLSLTVVSQDVTLFDTTIYNNITTWNTTIRQEDVIRAAKDACLHDEITEKPGGYDYVLKENGANISGGQRQRIEIAKALALNPTILIMDEATSSLDSTTEKKILDNIKKRHITCIVSAQRLSTIRDCDEIIVISKGVIRERGTHDQLIALNGMYKKLVSEAE